MLFVGLGGGKLFFLNLCAGRLSLVYCSGNLNLPAHCKTPQTPIAVGYVASLFILFLRPILQDFWVKWGREGTTRGAEMWRGALSVLFFFFKLLELSLWIVQSSFERWWLFFCILCSRFQSRMLIYINNTFLFTFLCGRRRWRISPQGISLP